MGHLPIFGKVDVPKVFSNDDREAIRRTLLDVGRTHFLSYGIRRTRIEELASAAGIAKGTFYSFFDSKEDLCMELYDEEESRLEGEIHEIVAQHEDPREMLRAVMVFSLEVLHRDSLLMRLRETGEYSLLARGVGREKLLRHQENDVGMAEWLLTVAREKGGSPDVDPALFAAVLRAVAMLSFHEREIGEDAFSAVIDLVADAIALRLTGRRSG